jgi:hypothetical protein
VTPSERRAKEQVATDLVSVLEEVKDRSGAELEDILPYWHDYLEVMDQEGMVEMLFTEGPDDIRKILHLVRPDSVDRVKCAIDDWPEVGL